ncbi:MAG: TolB-like translocation protein [Acidimicrobiales bacterium]
MDRVHCLPAAWHSSRSRRRIRPPIRPKHSSRKRTSANAGAGALGGYLLSQPGLVPTNPSFSSDGKWLAFVASKEIGNGYGNQVVSSTLWLARANGTGAHPVTGIESGAGIPSGTAFGWNPHRDIFAVSVGKATTVPFGDGVGDPPHVLHRPGRLVAGLGHRLHDGRVRCGPGWIGDTRRLSPLCDCSARVNPSCAREDAPGREHRQAVCNLDRLAPFVSSYDGGRLVWQRKQVMVCSSVTTRCSRVPHPSGTVTVDPVWSPSDAALAYVQAPSLSGTGFPQRVVASWYNAHRLCLYDPTTGAVQAVAQAHGATVPLWSHAGTSLLYVSNNGLWLHAARTRATAQIARPIFTVRWPTYCGQVPFTS